MVGTHVADPDEKFEYHVSAKARANTFALSGASELRFDYDGVSYEVRIVEYVSRGAIEGGPAECSAIAELWETDGRASLVQTGSRSSSG